MENSTTPQAPHSSRKVIWIFVAVGVIVIAIAIIGIMYGRMHPQTASNSTTKPLVRYPVQTTDIATTKLPNNFPADFPQEAGATVVQNYQATTPDARQQSTRTYTSAKSLDDNLKIFKDYFTKGGWTINDSQTGSNYRTILASKNGLLIQVAITQSAAGSPVTVNTTIIPQTSGVSSSAPATPTK